MSFIYKFKKNREVSSGWSFISVWINIFLVFLMKIFVFVLLIFFFIYFLKYQCSILITDLLFNFIKFKWQLNNINDVIKTEISDQIKTENQNKINTFLISIINFIVSDFFKEFIQIYPQICINIINIFNISQDDKIDLFNKFKLFYDISVLSINNSEKIKTSITNNEVPNILKEIYLNLNLNQSHQPNQPIEYSVNDAEHNNDIIGQNDIILSKFTNIWNILLLFLNKNIILIEKLIKQIKIFTILICLSTIVFFYLFFCLFNSKYPGDFINTEIGYWNPLSIFYAIKKIFIQLGFWSLFCFCLYFFIIGKIFIYYIKKQNYYVIFELIILNYIFLPRWYSSDINKKYLYGEEFLEEQNKLFQQNIIEGKNINKENKENKN